MTKATIIFAVIVLALVYVQAEPPPRCPPVCHKDEHSPVKCVRVSSTICRKMRQCSIDEANCKRRLTKQRLLIPTSLSRCRNIKGDVGSGRCAKRPVRKSRSTCKHLVCDDHSKVLRCYRSKRNNCRLLTVCGAKRLNCRRGWTNVVRPVDKHQCAGLRPGKRQRCRTLKKEE